MSQSHSHWSLCSVIVNVGCLLYSLSAQHRSGRLLPVFVPFFTNTAFYLIGSLPNYIPIRGHPLQLSVTYQLLILDEFASDPSSFIFLLSWLIKITRSFEMPHIALYRYSSNNNYLQCMLKKCDRRVWIGLMCLVWGQMNSVMKLRVP